MCVVHRSPPSTPGGSREPAPAAPLPDRRGARGGHAGGVPQRGAGLPGRRGPLALRRARQRPARALDQQRDRKSTRLNSSHVAISYAVFCLKKKKKKSKQNTNKKQTRSR